MTYNIENLSITPEILKLNRYNHYFDRTKDRETYVSSWQKRFDNDHGKAYFINFNFFDLSLFHKKHNLQGNPFSWEADLQLHSLDEDMTINLKVYGTNKTLEEVEKFCEKMFNKMQLRNYEYYSDEDENNHKREIKKAEVIEEASNLDKELTKKNNSKSKPKSKL